MNHLEERHKIKFLRIFENELNRFEKPTILEFGVSNKALSTSIFLNKQTGVECPTNMVWLGSPFPQFEVPSILFVSILPTLDKLFQNDSVTPL